MFIKNQDLYYTLNTNCINIQNENVNLCQYYISLPLGLKQLFVFSIISKNVLYFKNSWRWRQLFELFELLTTKYHTKWR